MSTESPYSTIDEALAEIREGRMIIVVDDEDRENEGDLVMAAQFATPEAVNFMAKEARGLDDTAKAGFRFVHVSRTASASSTPLA